MDRWEERLTEGGYRITAARRAVIGVLLGQSVPLCPQEILARGQRLHAPLGLVTVYRTLDLLEGLALVRRIHREDGCRGYLPASPGHRHAIVCRCCGQVAEFAGGEDLDGLAVRVQETTGYRVEDHLLQFLGLCPRCQVRWESATPGAGG